MTRRTILKLALASCLAPFIPSSHPYSRYHQMYAKRRGEAIRSFQEFMERTSWQPPPEIFNEGTIPAYQLTSLLSAMEGSCPPNPS